MKAIWGGTVLAESEQTVVVEGNHYFPPDSIKREYFNRAIRTRPVIGKASRATITFRSATGRILTLHGIIPSPRPLPSRSRIT